MSSYEQGQRVYTAMQKNEREPTETDSEVEGVL